MLAAISSRVNLTPLPVVIAPDLKGRLVFDADDASLHGEALRVQELAGKSNVGYWDRADEWISWPAKISKPGIFEVSATFSTIHADATFVVEVGGEKISVTPPATGAWDKFTTRNLGRVEIRQPGEFTVTVRARDAASWKAINLNSVRLSPVEAK